MDDRWNTDVNIQVTQSDARRRVVHHRTLVGLRPPKAALFRSLENQDRRPITSAIRGVFLMVEVVFWTRSQKMSIIMNIEDDHDENSISTPITV